MADPTAHTLYKGSTINVKNIKPNYYYIVAILNLFGLLGVIWQVFQDQGMVRKLIKCLIQTICFCLLVKLEFLCFCICICNRICVQLVCCLAFKFLTYFEVFFVILWLTGAVQSSGMAQKLFLSVPRQRNASTNGLVTPLYINVAPKQGMQVT